MHDESIKELSKVISGIRDQEYARDFLMAILTPQERARIALRWQLVCLLEAGMKQRAIAEKLGVSLCKITRGSRELKHGPKRFRKIVRKSVRSTYKK